MTPTPSPTPAPTVRHGAPDEELPVRISLRQAYGQELRHLRHTQHRTLRDVSEVARVSLGHLCDIEMGKKEPSSEILAAVCSALKIPLHQFVSQSASRLAAHGQ